MGADEVAVRLKIYSRAGELIGSFPLRDGVYVVGRNPSCDIVCEGAPNVSRRHAEIVVAGRRAKLRDLGSMVGSFVNGKLVVEADLADGDEIVLGVMRILVDLRERPDGSDDVTRAIPKISAAFASASADAGRLCAEVSTMLLSRLDEAQPGRRREGRAMLASLISGLDVVLLRGRFAVDGLVLAKALALSLGMEPKLCDLGAEAPRNAGCFLLVACDNDFLAAAGILSRYRVSVEFDELDRDAELAALAAKGVTSFSPLVDGVDFLRAAASLMDGVAVPREALEFALDISRALRPGVPGSGVLVGVDTGTAREMLALAKAFAVLEGRAVVVEQDVVDAAFCVLPHKVEFEAGRAALPMSGIAKAIDEIRASKEGQSK